MILTPQEQLEQSLDAINRRIKYYPKNAYRSELNGLIQQAAKIRELLRERENKDYNSNNLKKPTKGARKQRFSSDSTSL